MHKWVWVPAAMIVVAATLSIFGFSLVPSADALTDTKNVTVTATVQMSVWGAEGCGGAVAYGTPLTGSLGDTQLGNCTFTFGTNSTASTAVLTLQTAAAGGTNPFFCGTAGCTGGGANQGQFANSGVNVATMADGAFGFGHLAGGFSNCTTALTDGSKSPIGPAPGTTACTQTSAARNAGNDGSYTATFWANPATGTPAGDYTGRLDAVATAT